MDALIRQAMTEKRLLEFLYQGYARIAEPQVYGRKGGIVQMLVFQVGGGSKSGRLPDWRRVDLPKCSGLRMLKDTFAGRRDNPSGEHSPWDEIFAIVT